MVSARSGDLRRALLVMTALRNVTIKAIRISPRTGRHFTTPDARLPAWWHLPSHTVRRNPVLWIHSTKQLRSPAQRSERAIAKAGESLHNLDWFEVAETRGHIVDGKIAHYQVKVKIGFRLE